MFRQHRILLNPGYYVTPDNEPSQIAKDFARDYFIALTEEVIQPPETVHTPETPFSPNNVPLAAPMPLTPVQYALKRYNNIERFIEDNGAMTLHVTPEFEPMPEMLQGRALPVATIEYRWAQEGIPTDQWSLDGESESRVTNFPPLR